MMDRGQAVAVLVFGWLMLGLLPARADQIVFDNLTGASVPFFGPGCCQIGDEINLSGTVDLLTIGAFSQGFNVVAAIEMGIYANDGPGGSPGSLLWQSGPLTGLNVPSTGTEITIRVPDIAVPDEITVTSQILSSNPVALGRLDPAPPATGILDGTWIEITPGQWGPGVGFAVQVATVPEPSVDALLVTGLIGIAWVRFRHAHVRASRGSAAAGRDYRFNSRGAEPNS